MHNHTVYGFSIVAFLLRHLVTIEHSPVYLIYNNCTEVEAEPILTALHSVSAPVTCSNVDTVELGPAFNQRALTISLVNESQLLGLITTNAQNELRFGYF